MLKKVQINFRVWSAFALCISIMVILTFRMIYINLNESDFLLGKGIDQYGKFKELLPKRGKIYDRNGELLAISAEAYSIFVRPSKFGRNPAKWRQLEKYLGQRPGYIKKRISGPHDGDFIYLQPRLLAPNVVRNIMDLGLEGLGKEKTFQRFYPQRDSTSHIIGFTNDDHTGQEGIELIFDSHLSGRTGKKKVFLDAKGRQIASPDLIVPMVEGKDLYLTIDYRAQFYSNKILKESINYHNADSGSIIIIDSGTGEIITMVNAPSFNPNSRPSLVAQKVRNRAITDPHEPGSTLKPFVIAAALENSVLQPFTKINTSPGLLKVGSWQIGDGRDHGIITVEQILEKSSNVGAAKISDKLTENGLLKILQEFGFGEYTGAMLPGESTGKFPDSERMSFLKKRSLSFGYGISVTTSQLARAYSVFANNGSILDLKISKQSINRSAIRVISEKTSSQILTMLRKAVKSGTGTRANIANFKVAGKTGTVRKASKKGYSSEAHTVFFVGILPTNLTNYVCAIVIDKPRENGSTGGEVAAPIFSKLMKEIVRIFALKALPSSQGI